jgi:hypothetical protein
MSTPSTPEPTRRLERRYRQLLRAYPVAWRQTREEEILGVLMDGARPGRRRPTIGEA